MIIGFIRNFSQLSRVSRINSVSPYNFGAGNIQYGKNIKFKQKKYLPSVGAGEEVLSEAKEKQTLPEYNPPPIINKNYKITNIFYKWNYRFLCN